MIVEKLIKGKKGYTIIVEDKSYDFDEEIILEYRLVEGKEINDEILELAIKKNRVISYYYKAVNYAINYGKNKAQIYDYLENKGLSNHEIMLIIEKLNNSKIIDEDKLISSIVDTYLKKGYGVLFIENKLYEKQYNKDQIRDVISNINPEIYNEALLKIFEKIKDKYNGNSYEKVNKITRYLLARGYTYEDINALDIRTKM